MQRLDAKRPFRVSSQCLVAETSWEFHRIDLLQSISALTRRRVSLLSPVAESRFRDSLHFPSQSLVQSLVAEPRFRVSSTSLPISAASELMQQQNQSKPSCENGFSPSLTWMPAKDASQRALPCELPVLTLRSPLDSMLQLAWVPFNTTAVPALSRSLRKRSFARLHPHVYC